LITAALQLADREIAAPEEIDFVWKKITRMPVGPFGIMDTIGLDLVQQVLSNGRWVGDHEAIQKLVDVLEPYVKSGELGVKTGKGFFSYASNSGPTPTAVETSNVSNKDQLR
jgi:3-hydroxybutyryl-CoA dehydrogenase